MAGLVGPKAQPKGVADGYQVNIPELCFIRLYDVGTHRDNGDASMDCIMHFKVRNLGKSGLHIGKRNASSSRPVFGFGSGQSPTLLWCQEKPLRRIERNRTVIEHPWIGREYQGERDNHA